MPKYLSKDELFRLLQRESPEDVYADGAPSAFYTTADNAAVAKTLESAYLNQERIYLNYFPLSADEKIADHEITVFGQVAEASLTLQQRRDRIVAKLRERRDLSLWTKLVALLEYVPEGTVVRIFQWYRTFDEGSWELDVSRLNVDTFLGGEGDSDSDRSIQAFDFDYCDLPDNDFWQTQRTRAYGYEVQIFGYALSDSERAAIDLLLNRIEAARSQHWILDDLDLTDYGLVYTVTPVDRETLLDNAYKDPMSSTGYSGRSADA